MADTDDLVNWDGGHSAKEALYWCGVKYVSDAWLGLSPDQKKLRPLLDKLIAGRWYAIGYQVPITPESQPVRVPAHLWEVLCLDPNTDSVARGGLEYVRLRFYDGLLHRPRRGRPKRDVPLTQRAEGWADEMRRQPKRTKREVAQEIAKREQIDTETVARETRRARARKKRGTAGRRTNFSRR